MDLDIGGGIGNIGKVISSTVIVGIAAIVLLTFAPAVIGDIDGMHLQTEYACEVSGERFTKVVAAGTSTANQQWKKTGGGAATPVTEAICTAVNTGGAAKFYTPKGTALVDKAAANVTAPTGLGGVWDPPSESLVALGGGSLVTLLFGAMAILVPAGAIGFLAYTGAELANERLPLGLIGGAITAVVVVIVVGALLPQIFTPLDDLYVVMDGHRYVVFSEGIGKLAGVLANFMGLSLVAGIVAIGALIFKAGRSSTSDSMM